MRLKNRWRLCVILFLTGFVGLSAGCVSAFFKGIEQEMGLGTEERSSGSEAEFEQLRAMVAQIRAAMDVRLAADDEPPLPDVVVEPGTVSVSTPVATGVGGSILTVLGVLFWKKFGLAMIPGMSK